MTLPKSAHSRAIRAGKPSANERFGFSPAVAQGLDDKDEIVTSIQQLAEEIMETLWQDLRQGVRALLKQPAFTFVAIFALALGIGANTAIFSVVNAVLLQALPYRQADGLVTVWENNKRRGNAQNVINLGNYFDWKEQNQVFEDMATFFDTNANLTGSGEPEEIPSQIASANLFSVLGVTPMLGRGFTPDDGKDGAPRVVVLSYGLWQRRFGGESSVIGRKIILNNNETTVVGVLPPDFTWHVRNGSMTRKVAEMWTPWQMNEGMRQRRGRFAMAVARLKPGVSPEQAQAEMNVLSNRLEQQYEFNKNWGINVVPLRTQFTGEIRLALIVLLCAVGLVLLIACANVANLLLVRAAARQREIAVRAALGANRLRVIRQLLTESLVLAAAGGAAGLVLAWWGTDLLVKLSPPELLGQAQAKINLPVLGFTLGVSLLTGLIFGLAPAFETTRLNLTESLKDGGKNVGGSSRSHRLRNALVVTEVALALVLLIGAGLLIRSFARLQAVNPGFNVENVLTMKVGLPGRKYDTDQKIIGFYRQALAEMQTLPGVESAGAVSFLPLAAPHAGTNIEIEGRPKLPPGQQLGTGVIVTDANYFKTMQIPLKRGRLYTNQEAAEMRHVVVVNESFARKNFPGEDPLGKRVVIYMKDDNQPCEIIGVVGDTKHMTLDAESQPISYWPHSELAYNSMSFVLRTKGEATAVAAAAREVIRKLDPEQPVADVRTMESLLGRVVARQRFNTLLLTIFAGVAALLAAVGIYGVMAYSVAQRTHEIGVRLALGARKADVLRLVVKRGMTLSLAGVGIGLAASFALTRLMAALLFNVGATDPLTFAGVPVLLVLIALLACWLPARRAAKVDPMVALRYE
ncbi:MAG TPA: ABC transporter permease [Blastocatellia bacterium]|nr:ABC transporter permease [Blastocatellia bacterium]